MDRTREWLPDSVVTVRAGGSHGELAGGRPIFPALHRPETLRTGGYERQNVFETWAALEDGGYR